MLYIGPHTSIQGSLEHAPLQAHSLGATAFALFTKNQRQWASKPITEEQAHQFKKACASLGFTKAQILPHDSYLINLGNPDEQKRRQSLEAFVDEMQRVSLLGLDKLNFHPGAHVNKTDRESCLRLVSQSLDEAMDRVEGVMPVIETTAGQGSNVGSSFEELDMLLQFSKQRYRLGVCIDTCHIFAAGYDLRSEEAFENTMQKFERIVGFNYLQGMHLNDAKSTLNSHLDRHESLGKGSIGIEAFIRIAKDRRFHAIPLILETVDSSLWSEEIALLKKNSEGVDA